MTILGVGLENADEVSGAGTDAAEFDLHSDEQGHPEGPVEPVGCQEAPGRHEAHPQTSGAEGRSEEQPEGKPAPETPKNGNGRKEMDRDQKAAITKMASRYQVQAETLDRVLAAVKSYDEAAKVISELNRGDISRFLPAPA